ncbi:MAG: dTMP kinase [Desulfopila sp.]|nr:dTMP kinase [Desulfopila sp.]
MTDHNSQYTQNGTLIVFEGIDGTGKSTQLKLLAEYLSEKGHDVISTREPTDGIYGQKIRALYRNRDKTRKEEELSLFLLDRREHVDRVLNPALAAGRTILCDRYFLSTIAYQGAAGMDPSYIASQNSFAPTPDLAFIFQLAPEVSIERITHNRGDVLNDFEEKESLSKAEMIFNSLNFPYIHYINAAQSIAQVHQDVVAVVESFFRDKR